MTKRTILVAGLGLIGGSLAKGMALDPDQHVIGYDINEHTLTFALDNGIIDEIALDFKAAAKRADIVMLASPITATIHLMKELDKIDFDHDIIVTDACSVKGSILETAGGFVNENIYFIGGHPMAGSHKMGVQAAKTHLFENAIYVLTPTEEVSDEQIDLLKDALKQTKSRFVVLKPAEHDEMTGVVSHFPHLIASSLVHQAKKWQKRHPYLPELAAGGFRDITRIASSSPELWQDIFYHNHSKLSVMLDDWIQEMTEMKKLIEQDDKQEMIAYLAEAKAFRDGLGTKGKGAIPAFHDLYVDIRDQPGALAKVIQLLAEQSINVTNLRILEIREGITGALRLSLGTKEEQQKAAELLKDNGYEVMIEI